MREKELWPVIPSQLTEMAMKYRLKELNKHYSGE